MRLWLVLVLCMLALSCHREGAEVTTLPPGPPAQGRCPDDPRPLVVAIQQVISDERTDDTNLDRVRRPVLFEHLRLMESDELYEGNWYVPLTSFDVQPGDPLPEGVPRSEDPVWVLSGGEPCPMTAGRRLRLQMSLGGPPL